MYKIKNLNSAFSSALVTLLLIIPLSSVQAQTDTELSASELTLQEIKLATYLGDVKHNVGKSVTVEYDVLSKIQPGQSVELELTFTPSSYAKSAKVDITADNLELLSHGTAIELTFDGNKAETETLVVYSSQPVRGYVNVFLEITLQNDQKTGQVLSIPVQFGDSSQIPISRKAETSIIPGYHVLPAQQKID